MSAKIHIKAHETGVLRLFAVDIPASDIAAFRARNGRWPLRDALGAVTLDPEYVEMFDIGDLSGVGLPGYLSEGHAIPDEQIAGMRGRLDALKGTLLLISSRAFAGQEQTLEPRAPLRLIATFTRAHEPVRFGALPDASARSSGSVDSQPRKPASDAAISGRVATAVLLVLAALVALMVWVAS